MAKADWSDSHAMVHRQLKARALLPSKASVIIAVSGGQDSITLLKLLVDLQPKWQWHLQVIHCNHRWRKDSGDNARFVEQLCVRWNIPCEIISAAEPLANEAQARLWRYQVFENSALRNGYSHIVTGHTATDRAETLLYNLIRGSGADGLQALVWERPISKANSYLKVVRPLLNWTRQDTAAFCRRFSLPIWEDSTNQDTGYARNRIRLDVMPQLKEHFNPAVELTLAQTAELLTADVDYLEQVTHRLYDAVVQPSSTAVPWRIQRQPLRQAHLALQRRVMRQVLQQITTTQVNFEAVEKLVALIHAPNRTQTDPFAGGVIGSVEGDWIIFRQ
jgi:tRNA(Ile)-lysidine synthase